MHVIWNSNEVSTQGGGPRIDWRGISNVHVDGGLVTKVSLLGCVDFVVDGELCMGVSTVKYTEKSALVY